MPLRIISLGWAVQSWALAAMVALGEIPPVDYAIHADTTHEATGTYIHAAKYTSWLEDRGVKVITVKGSRPDVVREDWGSVMIPAFTTDRETGSQGQVRRQCTHDWKILPIRKFIRSVIGKPTPGRVHSLQGISLDEFQRMRTSDVKYIENFYPLIDLKITRADCTLWLQSHGLDVPVKSACTFCPFHSLAAWKRLKREGGKDWGRAVEVDKAIRNKRPKAALFIHPGRKPLVDAIRIPEDEGAYQSEMEFEQPCDAGMCFV